MTDQTETRDTIKEPDTGGMDPVQIVRQGAIAASIWQRQSPAGEVYYDFSLSRSWKSVSKGTSGYSRSFFEKNEKELVEVIQKATAWIAAQPQGKLDADTETGSDTFSF
ncbi:MAG: hypothetical protein NT069_33405 [Planctomycetota bacterium]|nr:hypothetical protein [Planctomycetota bacterium]